MIKIQRLLASWANLAFGLGLDFRPSGLLLTGGGANGARKEDWTEVYKSSIWSSWLLTRPRPNWSLTQSLKICFCIFLSTSTVACHKRQTSVLPLFSAVYKPSLIKSSVYKDLSTVHHHPKSSSLVGFRTDDCHFGQAKVAIGLEGNQRRCCPLSLHDGTHIHYFGESNKKNE